MFELLAVVVGLLFLVPAIGVALVVCGAVAGFGALFDAIGGVVGAVFGLIAFFAVLVMLVVGGVFLGFVSLFF